MKLSQEQIDQFWEDGFLIIEGLLSDADVATVLDRAERVARGDIQYSDKAKLQVEPRVAGGELQVANTQDSIRKMSHLAFHDEVFESHARHPKILDVIESLLGADIKLYQDQFFMKPPRVGSRQPYHQDMPLGFKIYPPAMVTCWAALNDASIENGCLWMLPGTHKFGIIENTKWQDYEKQSLEGTLPAERPIELKAGSCSFHHGLTLHSSRPNLTDQRRRGYATHYVSAKCRYTGSPEENDAILVRGQSFPDCI